MSSEREDVPKPQDQAGSQDARNTVPASDAPSTLPVPAESQSRTQPTPPPPPALPTSAGLGSPNQNSELAQAIRGILQSGNNLRQQLVERLQQLEPPPEPNAPPPRGRDVQAVDGGRPARAGRSAAGFAGRGRSPDLAPPNAPPHAPNDREVIMVDSGSDSSHTPPAPSPIFLELGRPLGRIIFMNPPAAKKMYSGKDFHIIPKESILGVELYKNRALSYTADNFSNGWPANFNRSSIHLETPVRVSDGSAQAVGSCMFDPFAALGLLLGLGYNVKKKFKVAGSPLYPKNRLDRGVVVSDFCYDDDGHPVCVGNAAAAGSLAYLLDLEPRAKLPSCFWEQHGNKLIMTMLAAGVKFRFVTDHEIIVFVQLTEDQDAVHPPKNQTSSEVEIEGAIW